MKIKIVPDAFYGIAEKLKKYKFVLLVLLLGVVLILLPTGKDAKTEQPQAGGPEGAAFSLAEEEARIAEALSKIDGAGKVKVVLTLKTGVEQVLAYDTEEKEKRDPVGEDAELSKNASAVIISQGSSVQKPVTLKYIYPEYQGALVVSQGAGNAEVRLQLNRAVSALTGLGSDKITITKMNDN